MHLFFPSSRISDDKPMSEPFSYFEAPSTPADLYQKVIFRLEKEAEEREKRQRLILAVGSLIASFAILIPAGLNLKVQLSASGLPQFLSLIFSDFSIVAAHYRSFLLSLVESFPFFATAFLLFGLFLLVESIRLFTKGSRKFFTIRLKRI